jgi:hypothetical protein
LRSGAESGAEQRRRSERERQRARVARPLTLFLSHTHTLAPACLSARARPQASWSDSCPSLFQRAVSLLQQALRLAPYLDIDVYTVRRECGERAARAEASVCGNGSGSERGSERGSE